MIVVYDFVDISFPPIPLTLGKSYAVVSEDTIGYSIVNDNGETLFYSKHRFIELSLHRSNKLNIWVINDAGIEKHYSSKRFVDIQKYREMQLNELIIE